MTYLLKMFVSLKGYELMCLPKFRQRLTHLIGEISVQPKYECRYEERDRSFKAEVFFEGTGNVHMVLRGELDTRPEWLVALSNVLRVGGHLEELQAPPPDRVVWVTLGDDYRLLNVNMSTKTKGQ